MRSSFVLPLLLSACSGWPLADNIPPLADDTVSASTPLTEAWALAFDWHQGQEGEPNDEPGEPVDLAPLEGRLVEGELRGIGWDEAAEVDRQGGLACEGRLAFPVAVDDEGRPVTGDYTGDVDWFPLHPKTAGTLCATVALDAEALRDQPDAPTTSALQVDLLLFALDACGLPTEVIRYTAPGAESTSVNDEIVGYNYLGDTVEWGVPVQSGISYGVSLASPDDGGDDWGDYRDLTIPYRLSVALSPDGSAEVAGLCPTPPAVLP